MYTNNNNHHRQLKKNVRGTHFAVLMVLSVPHLIDQVTAMDVLNWNLMKHNYT